MNLTSAEIALWNRIEKFSLDDSTASFSFTQRLARDNHWSLAFATRVVEEYKRFMFLAVACDHVVSPSDEVDQAWHLHLVYTQSYWDEFCGDLLQKPIHHGPTRGGKVESDKFEDLYERTKQSYRNKFGEQPPTDIWPSSEIRFDREDRKHWVSSKNYWLIRKPDFSKLISGEALPVLFAATIPATLFAWSPFDLNGPAFLVFYGVAAVFVAIAAMILQRIFSSDGAQWELEKSRFKLTPNHVAYLSGGRKQLLQSAICELLVDGQAKSLRQQLKYEHTAGNQGRSDVARAILKKLKNELSMDNSQIINATKVPVASISADLAKVGLIQSRVKVHLLTWMSGLMMAGVFGLGVVRIFQAIGRGRPFGFLVLEMTLVLLVAAGVFVAVPFRTKAGNKVLAKQKLAARKIKADQDLHGIEIGFLVGALGLTALSSTAYRSFSTQIGYVLSAPISTGGGGGGGCGGGSGCGGGGGGGGCGGGCGGCGG